MGTRTKTCLVEPVVGSPLLYKCSYIDPYRDINILSIYTKYCPRGPHLLAITRIFKYVLFRFLSITRLLGLMLGIFKPDGIEFG
jgi:hypothetical protein